MGDVNNMWSEYFWAVNNAASEFLIMKLFLAKFQTADDKSKF